MRSSISNLPAPRISLVGRDREVSTIRHELMHTAGRLLTLTGTGGVGKTQLALQVADGLVGAFPDGVWLVELASLAEPGLVAQSVASALQLRAPSQRPDPEVLLRHLRDRRLLLVLDNCEHLVDACARLADTLLTACQGLRILATSRERLRISGEAAYRVPPLPAPDPAHVPPLEKLIGYPAVRLFVDRARAVREGFRLGAGDADAIARLCAGLGGIPLAIELAAARVTTLTVAQMAERLDDAAHLLVGGSRTAPSRHQRLWATLEWSYRLLTPPERQLFERLSVFAGGCDLEAAERVCARSEDAGNQISPSDSVDVVDLLGGLVDKSLVLSSEERGRVRFQLLEPVRQFAREKLEANGEAAAVRERHATCFLEVAQRAELATLTADQAAWFDRLERDLDNLRMALDWSRAEPHRLESGLCLAGALWRFWDARGHLTEGRTWLAELLAQATSAPTGGLGRALFAAGWLAAMQESDQAALPLADRSVAIWRQLADWRGLAWSLYLAGLVQRHRDPESGLRLAEEGLRLVQEHEDRTLASWMLWLLGELRRTSGHAAAAETFFEQALVMARDRDDPVAICYILRSLGQIAGQRGDYPKATAVLRERLILSRRVEDQWNLPDALESLAWLAGAQQQAERAARLYGAAEAVRQGQGMLLSAERRARREQRARSLCGALGEARFDEAWAAGRAMSLEQAMAYALEDTSGTARREIGPEHPVAPLSRRELEVAKLLARGLTNRDIARELTIAEGTAGVHVVHILNKLGLHSRWQVADWAMQHGFIPASSSIGSL